MQLLIFFSKLLNNREIWEPEESDYVAAWFYFLNNFNSII